MKRGNLYRVAKPSRLEPKKFRVFAVVSRQELIDSSYSTVVCAPVYSSRLGLSTEVAVGIEEGLKHESSVRCDELLSLPKTALTHYVGSIAPPKLRELNRALRIALGISGQDL